MRGNTITNLATTTFVLIAALLLSVSFAQAAVDYPVMPFKVIKKLEIPQGSTPEERHALVLEIAEIIKDNIEDYSHDYLKLMTSMDGMEPHFPVEIIHFPTTPISGQDEFAAEVEVLTEKDLYYFDKFGNGKAIGGPWSITIFSTSSMTAEMMTQVGKKLDLKLGPVDPKDYIIVSIINPLAVSKVSYQELKSRDNRKFNLHCRNVGYKLQRALTRILDEQTLYDWKTNVNPMYDGLLPILNKDLDKLTKEEITPTLLVPDINADVVADTYTDYVKELAPKYKPGGTFANTNKMVQVLFGDLFAWQDPNASFDCDLSAYGGPVLHYDNLDDFKAQFGGLVDSMFGPLWDNNLTSQGWKYGRRLQFGEDGNINLMEMCTKFYAITALGTGLHHTPAMPCMVSIYQEGDDAGLSMYTAKATFTFFFKDATMMMEMLDMPVQAFMFAAFPDFIYNDEAALLNGSLDNLNVDPAYRFKIKRFSK